MQQIEMRCQLWRLDRPRHREAILEQRPVERFAVKRHKHRTLREPRRQFMQNRMFFVKIAHEKLFDLQATRIPPGEPN